MPHFPPLFFNDKLFSFFLIVSILVLSIRPAEGLSPVWLKEGAYAKYGNFRWECIRIEGNTAQLKVTYTSGGTMRSALVYVDTETRGVTLVNGTRVGKTLLWLPANLRQDETIVLNGNLTAKVRISPGSWQTPQGNQKTFTVENWTIPFSGEYDLNTGILIYLFYSGEEATLRALNIQNLDGLQLSETNIDLGPREWWPEIATVLPIFLPVIAFALIFIVLLHRRIKKHRRIIQRVKTSKSQST